MNYKPEDIVITWSSVVHERTCATFKSTLSNWVEVSSEELYKFVDDNKLKAHAHTIADTIGYHLRNADSDMLAKVYLGYGSKDYYIWSDKPVGEKYDCDCKPTKGSIELKGFHTGEDLCLKSMQ